MKLYLIRHGMPDVSEYSGFPGPNLGPLGRRQSNAICEFLRDKDVRTVLASDYTRVIQTAKPFVESKPEVKYAEIAELRERENDIESHESLVIRVQEWFASNLEALTQQNTALFGHCGSINMILLYLDGEQKLMNYPYEDQYKCLTPIGGIWELNFQNGLFIGGELFKIAQGL